MTNMVSVTNSSELAQITRFMMPNRLLNPVDMHPNGSLHAFPPYYYGIDGINEFNGSLSNYYNNYTLYYISCPSIQVPAGNLISMILYALVCIIGLFGM